MNSIRFKYPDERLGISWGTAKERLRELEIKDKVSTFNKGKRRVIGD